MSGNPSRKDIPKELAEFMELNIKAYHSLLNPEDLLIDTSKVLSVSVEQIKPILYDLYKNVFDEFLEGIKNGVDIRRRL